MPNSLVKSFAKKSGKSISRVEDLWKNAEDIVKKEYNLSKNSKRYYPLVVGVLKNSLGLNQEDLSFLEYQIIKNNVKL